MQLPNWPTTDENATHWDHTGGEGAGSTTYLDYENTVTGERLSVGVSNHVLENGDGWCHPAPRRLI